MERLGSGLEPADWLLLPVRPWSLARVAAGMKPAAAFLHTALSLSLVVIPTLAFLLGQISEPYRDLEEYYRHVRRAVPWVALFGTFFSFLLVALLTGAGLFWQNIRNPDGVPGDAPVRALLLNFSALLIPLAVWLAAYVMAGLGHPAFGLIDQPKPALWTSLLVQFLGSWTGFLWFVGLYGLNLTWALRQLPPQQEKSDDT